MAASNGNGCIHILRNSGTTQQVFHNITVFLFKRDQVGA